MESEIRVIQENCKGRINVVEKLCDKLDSLSNNINKFVVDITKIITRHEDRLNQADQDKKDIIREFREGIDKLNNKMDEQIKSVLSEIEKGNNKSEEKYTKLEDRVNQIEKDIYDKIDSIDQKLNIFDRYKWFIFGGIIVVYFITSGRESVGPIVKILFGL
jgi:uncharacterized phage infection (PIP) family protein YhgE